ncbi:MAG: hypothetical protein J0I02_00180, partial [Alphaproteobacteria bacterium]|nr:hypothetical protein [Alphaproteobacteria bacterium]
MRAQGEIGVRNGGADRQDVAPRAFAQRPHLGGVQAAPDRVAIAGLGTALSLRRRHAAPFVFNFSGVGPLPPLPPSPSPGRTVTVWCV